jgi:hypothetical protein
VNEPLAIEARLAAHVESILNGAAFRKRDREDLAEELYGHLWQRWQDALAAGMDADAAADEAIRSFGEPARLGREVTLAYHSRLYASTIGVLVPTVETPKDRPRGYWLVWSLLFTTFFLMAYGQAMALMSWTPLRAGIGFGGTLMAFIAASLVYSAYSRRQRWALGFAPFELPLLLWWVVILYLMNPPEPAAMTIGAAGGLGTVVATSAWPFRLRPLSSWRDLRLRSLSSWLNERPIPRRLLAVLCAMLILGSAAPVVALNLPDPTQIGPDDMQVGLSVVCTRHDSGELSAVDVTASFVFTRTDVWPNGLVGALGGGGPTDYVALAVQGSRPNGIPMVTPMLTQTPTFRDATDGTHMAFGARSPDDGRLMTPMPESGFKAGHRYEIVWNYAVAPGITDLIPVTFGYDHLERFYLQATAGCGQAAIGQTVGQLIYVPAP